MPHLKEIRQHFENIRRDASVLNIWSTDQRLAQIVSNHSSLNITPMLFNRAMGTTTNSLCDSSGHCNNTGIYRLLRNRRYIYFITVEGTEIHQPILDQDFFKDVHHATPTTLVTTPAAHIDEDCQGLFLETRTQISERQTAHPAIPTITSSRKRKSPNTDLHSTPLKKRRKQRLIPSPANFDCSKVEPKYIPVVDVKSAYKVSSGMKSHETVQKKSTRILRRKLNTVHKRLNMVEKQLIDKSETIETLIIERKKYHNMILCDRRKLMYIVKKLKKKECQESDHKKLILRIGKIQANRASKEKKLECLITEAMKLYRTKTLPKELLRKNIRTYYTPWKIGKLLYLFLFYNHSPG